jgi:hypothetical protein
MHQLAGERTVAKLRVWKGRWRLAIGSCLPAGSPAGFLVLRSAWSDLGLKSRGRRLDYAAFKPVVFHLRA